MGNKFRGARTGLTCRPPFTRDGDDVRKTRVVSSGDNFIAIMRVDAPTLGRGESEAGFKKYGGLRVVWCGRFSPMPLVNNANPTNEHVIH